MTLKGTMQSILLLLCPLVIFAQDHDTWDMSSYEPPDHSYREFIVVPELSINSVDSSYKNTSSLSVERETNLFSNTHFGLYPDHRFHLYTKKLEIGGNNSLRLQYDAYPYIKNETDNYAGYKRNYHRDHDLNLSFETQDSARLYFPSGAFIGALGGVGFSNENRVSLYGYALNPKFDTLPQISYSRQYSSLEMINPSFSLFLGGGWGRIKDVTFGAVALNMFDRISDVLPGSAGISTDQIQDFAAFIEKRKRLRAFDSRMALIENIDTLCRYLVDNRAISGPSSAVTMELSDQWQYAFTQNRQAGLALSLYPGIMVNYSRHHLTDTASSWIDTLDYDLRLIDADLDNARKVRSYSETAYRLHEYQTELIYCLNSTFQVARPLSRFFQANGRLDVNMHWNHYFARSVPSYIGESDYETLLPTLEIDASFLFAYYPDTRTTFAFGPNVSYDRSFNYLINENKNRGTTMVLVNNDPHFDFRGMDIEFPLNFIYYISPRLQYRVSAATYLRSYYSSDQTVTKGWYSTYTVGAGLTYQFF
jgi:hypothetical protein